jgi:hypothetical protein
MVSYSGFILRAQLMANLPRQGVCCGSDYELLAVRFSQLLGVAPFSSATNRFSRSGPNDVFAED